MSRLSGSASDPSAARDPALPAAVALALALILLPLALHLPLDADRALPLLFVPALALAWRLPAPALPRGERIALLVALAALVLSSAFARNHAAAAVTAAAAGLALGGAAVSRRLSASPRAIRLVLGGMLLGPLLGFATVLGGWHAESMGFPTYWSARIFGAHAFSGALAGLGLLFLPGLAPTSRGARALVALGTLAVWTALAWSGSRAPALGLAVAAALWFLRETRSVRRGLLIAVPALGLLALACSRPLGTPYEQLGWWPAVARTVEAVEKGSTQVLTSDRTAYWAACWPAIRASPVLGNGADAYRFLTPKQPGNQPHNTYVQWLLEYGLLGAVPLCLLLASRLRPLLPASPTPAHDALARWSAAAVGGAAVYAFFDGVAYHMVVCMPVAVLVGWCGSSPTTPAAAVTPRAPNVALRLLTLCALGLLLLHAWLGLLLLRAPNVEPDAPAARLLRVFPSTTHGLSNWIARWQNTHPIEAEAWLAWAPTVSPDPARFHLQAAQRHLDVKNWVGAERELAAALDKVLLMERADVQGLLDEIRALIARSAASATSTSSAPAP